MNRELTLDADGLLTVPGLVDLHVHFREPGETHKEDVESGCRAAARGGYTTVCCMPNTKPVLDNRDAVEFVIRRGRELGLVDLYVAGALSVGEEGRKLTDFAELARAGVRALSDDGRTIEDTALMRLAAERAKALNLLIMDHVDNPGTVRRDIAIARETHCRIHLQHISDLESICLIREARRQGVPITAETAPHYFALTEAAVLTHGADAKMNPPLRAERDRQAVIEALRDGTIDAIATDHAPHTDEEKARPLAQAPSGVVGLETAFAVSYTALVRPGHLSPQGLICLMSTNPARILGIEPAGRAVFNVSEPYQINREEFVSKGKNTPFHGMTVYGRTKQTVHSGKISWEEAL